MTDPPSAAIPSGADTPASSASPGAPTSQVSVRDAIAAYQAAVAGPTTTLDASMQELPTAQSKHHAKVGPNEVRVIPMVIAMLRTYPNLSGVTADALSRVMDDVNACTGLSRSFEVARSTADATGRLRLETAWQVVSGAIATAREQSKQNATMAKDISGIDAILARGTRAEQAGHVAVKAHAKAARANARATKATAKSTAATARAASLQQGKGDATITPPAAASSLVTAPVTPTIK